MAHSSRAGEDSFQEREGQRKSHSFTCDKSQLTGNARVIKRELRGGGRVGTEEEGTPGEEVADFSKWIPKKTGSSAHKGYFCLDCVGPALNHLGFMILGK